MNRPPTQDVTGPPVRKPIGIIAIASIWLVASTRPCSSRPTFGWISDSQCALSTSSAPYTPNRPAAMIPGRGESPSSTTAAPRTDVPAIMPIARCRVPPHSAITTVPTTAPSPPHAVTAPSTAGEWFASSSGVASVIGNVKQVVEQAEEDHQRPASAAGRRDSASRRSAPCRSSPRGGRTGGPESVRARSRSPRRRTSPRRPPPRRAGRRGPISVPPASAATRSPALMPSPTRPFAWPRCRLGTSWVTAARYAGRWNAPASAPTPAKR